MKDGTIADVINGAILWHVTVVQGRLTIQRGRATRKPYLTRDADLVVDVMWKPEGYVQRKKTWPMKDVFATHAGARAEYDARQAAGERGEP
jgi:hypothetical protein